MPLEKRGFEEKNNKHLGFNKKKIYKNIRFECCTSTTVKCGWQKDTSEILTGDTPTYMEGSIPVLC